MTSRHDKVDRPMKLKITDVRAVVGDSGFLLDDGETAILCDSGFGFTGEAVAENIRKALGDRKLDYILLTHSHYDHVLGSTHIKARFPEAKIVAGVHAQAVFAKEKARRIMGELDRLRQGMPKTEVLEAVKAEVYLPHVRPAFPVDAFYLNTGIMIDLVEKELL